MLDERTFIVEDIMSLGSMYSNKRQGQLPEQQKVVRLPESIAGAPSISDAERERQETEVFAERMRLTRNGQTDDIVRGT